MGSELAGTAAEHLEYADCCYRKRLFVSASRFWERGFAAEPMLLADMQAPHRYNAACVAALAGCSKGEDADTIDDSERARLLQQAIDWLQAEREVWSTFWAEVEKVLANVKRL